MDTDGHGLRDFIIRHASLTKVRSASRRVTLAKQESDQRSSGTLFFALENSVYSVAIRAKKN